MSHAAATASRHSAVASARKIRSGDLVRERDSSGGFYHDQEDHRFKLKLWLLYFPGRETARALGTARPIGPTDRSVRSPRSHRLSKRAHRFRDGWRRRDARRWLVWRATELSGSRCVEPRPGCRKGFGRP